MEGRVLKNSAKRLGTWGLHTAPWTRNYTTHIFNELWKDEGVNYPTYKTPSKCEHVHKPTFPATNIKTVSAK